MKPIAFFLSVLLLVSISLSVSAQTTTKETFTRSDTLRGAQSAERTAYDINSYHLNIRIDPGKRFISGESRFKFTAVRDFKRLQFDLFENMAIEKVVYKNQELPFSREFNAVFIDFPETIKKETKDEFVVHYSGFPIVAKNAPWDGGLVFSKDKNGKPWVNVAVQGVGASLWWPNKDQQADQVDSILISIAVPDTLMNVSNGQFRGKTDLGDGYTRYDWFVSYPINPYNVTFNIGDYARFSDDFDGEKGKLTVDYYVLPENLEKAKTHFAENVHAMLSCFEHWFGPYPFYRDGFKLIESSHLGMEHQSAVAYGNKYGNGYLGRDNSGTGYGSDWDFIIIHESGHEWFGNNITAKDISDSWIHEGFTTYSEAAFVECKHGKKAAEAYVKGLRKAIRNEEPLLGKVGVDDEGSSDIYYKGANILQTVRTVIDNDETWRNILRGLNEQFHLKTVTTKDVVDFISQESGRDFSTIFKTYLEYAKIPTLEIIELKGHVNYRWNTAEKNFDLPVRVKLSDQSDWKIIHPTAKWKKLKTKDNVIVDTDAMYFNIDKK